MTETQLSDSFLNRISCPKLSGCWYWTGGHDRTGYGICRQNGKNAYAHRVAYEILIGPIPEGLEIDHLCRQPSCVNPKHMEPVTRRENILRGTGFPAQNAKRTHCPKGHSYSGNNLFIDSQNRRYCRACRADRTRRWRAKIQMKYGESLRSMRKAGKNFSSLNL